MTHESTKTSCIVDGLSLGLASSFEKGLAWPDPGKKHLAESEWI